MEDSEPGPKYKSRLFGPVFAVAEVAVEVDFSESSCLIGYCVCPVSAMSLLLPVSVNLRSVYEEAYDPKGWELPS
jgi:hypothetical protein